ncbi:hypothetical protein GMLC_16360 [Geomonas limicola]|uniref:Uncharacterized protein n=1 Tax=Geomonas limicola TaxID=2740186 RepID=A0A6V8N8F9_9BACT|nr:hypothetical protein GMLC_16360 [Geomonas limicola]
MHLGTLLGRKRGPFYTLWAKRTSTFTASGVPTKGSGARGGGSAFPGHGLVPGEGQFRLIVSANLPHWHSEGTLHYQGIPEKVECGNRE